MMKKVKCIRCGRALLLLDFGKLEIKCPRCKRINKIEIDDKIKSREGTKK